jgi:hypothetical protein
VRLPAHHFAAGPARPVIPERISGVPSFLRLPPSVRHVPRAVGPPALPASASGLPACLPAAQLPRSCQPSLLRPACSCRRARRRARPVLPVAPSAGRCLCCPPRSCSTLPPAPPPLLRQVLRRRRVLRGVLQCCCGWERGAAAAAATATRRARCRSCSPPSCSSAPVLRCAGGPPLSRRAPAATLSGGPCSRQVVT